MIATLLSLTVATAPPVQVELDGLALPESELQQLHGQLLTRLVEEGQAIGRPGVVTLRLSGGVEAVRVEVWHGRHVLARTVQGEGAVLRLAVTHAAIELLVELGSTPAGPDPALAAAPERTLVIEATAEAEPLLAGAIDAAIEAGMVVARQSDAGRRLCLGLDEHGEPRLGLVALPEPCEAKRPLVAMDRDLGELLAATPYRAPGFESTTSDGSSVDADDDEPDDEALDSATEPESTPRVPPASVPAPPPATPTSSPWTFVPGLAAGVQARLRTAEPAIVADLALRHRVGAVAWLRATYAPSRGGALRAHDAFVAAGAGWRFSVSPRVTFQVGVLAGVGVHTYALPPDRGARVDLDLELPLELGIRLARRIELGVLPLLGWTSRERQHVADDRTLWSRDRMRLGGAVGLRFPLSFAGNSDRR